MGIPVPSLASLYTNVNRKANNDDVTLTIHCGSDEIGGSCVEIEYHACRIILDFGMPLTACNGTDFEFSKYKSLSVTELISHKVLPDIKGLYESDKRKVHAVLISHPHFDHYGLLNYVNKEIPILISQPSLDLVDINNIFTPSKINISNPVYFPVNTQFQIGPFNITAYLNDHSSFVSYSFLIEAGDKKIFYSGDFRSHGRKGKSFYWFLHNCPKNVDALLMEGTTIGRGKTKFISESIIEKELIKYFTQPELINLIYTSSQNIDRLVSIYRACKRTNKTMVIDFYTATVLKTLSQYAKIPYPSINFPEIKVYYPKFLSNRISSQGNKQLLYQFKEYKITKQEIDNAFSSVVMLVRPSVKFDLERIKNIDGGNFIYSQWEGYRSKDTKTAAFVKYLRGRNMNDISLHTSGHADISTLQKYVTSINPKHIIPIHTDRKSVV